MPQRDNLRLAIDSKSRRGFSAIELVTAASVLGTLLLFLVPLLGRMKQADAVSSRKAFALREARNIVEQLQHLDSPVFPELSPRVRESLPEVNGELISSPDPPAESSFRMTRHTITLSWTESSGPRSVQLSWWKPAKPQEEP